MFSNIFNNRDKKISQIIKLGDCLGRSLRENVELFSVDGDEVIYVTESDNIIIGNVVSKGSDLVLTDIAVEGTDVFTENAKFDDFVSQKAGDFLLNLNDNNFTETKTSFSDLIGLWETRLNFDRVVKKLDKKRSKFNEGTTIIESTEFSKLVEITPKLVEFLKENFEEISKVAEISNSVKLSNTVSYAFDFEPITYDLLEKTGSYKIKNGVNESVYEIICNQELIKKELLESKEGFGGVWASNAKIGDLSTKIYCQDEDELLIALGESILEVPYLALATKKQIFETFKRATTINESTAISDKDIKAFATKVYDLKKPLKEALVSTLNEKYGINIQNLKEPPTFKSLLQAQTVIFESLSRLSPKKSVQRDVLSELARALKTKSGVEAIDVNLYICEMFAQAGYKELINETSLMQYLDFERVAGDLGKIGDVLRMLKAQGDPETGMGAGSQEQYPADEMLGGEGMEGEEEGIEPGMDMEPEEEQLPDEEFAGEEMAGEEEDLDQPAMSPEDAAMAAQDELGAEGPGGELENGEEGDGIPEEGFEEEGIPGEEMPEEGMEGEEGIPEEGMEGDPEAEKGELMASLSKLDALIQDLTAEIEGSESEMEGGEEGFEEEGEEGFEGEEEGVPEEGEHGSECEEDGEEEEAPFPPKKKK